MNTPTMARLFAVVLVCAAFSPGTAAGETPPFAWIEGENPTSANFKYNAQDHEMFSGGKRLHVGIAKSKVAQTVPAGGLNLKYALAAPTAGTYDLWLRVGFETIRAPIDWRVDGGAWQTLEATRPEVSLTEVWAWNGIGWCRAGTVKLAAGKHSLDIRVTKPGSDGRLLLSLDCAAFVKGRWNPELALKPGQTYSRPPDREAAVKAYQFPAAAENSPSARPSSPPSWPPNHPGRTGYSGRPE